MNALENNTSIRSINGVDIFVRDTGEQHLPAVLALHSLFLDGRMFEAFVQHAKGRFRVISPDFRGQGRNAPVNVELVGMETHAADIDVLIDSLGLSQIRLLAQSMGGDVGLRVVHRRPELFHSMALIGSSARSEPAEKVEGLDSWVDGIRASGFTGQILDETVSVMFGVTTRNNPAKVDEMKLWRGRIAEATSGLAPQLAGVNARGNLLDVLHEIPIPALVICGDEDIARPVAWSQEMASALPRSELIVMRGVGHSPTLEQPAIVLPKLLTFFT